MFLKLQAAHGVHEFHLYLDYVLYKSSHFSQLILRQRHNKLPGSSDEGVYYIVIT